MPSVAGCPVVDGLIEVGPGFDHSLEGLVVPWEQLTTNGLEITEEHSGALIRCIVGPIAQDTDDRDWLQLRSAKWEPIAKHRWVPLGKRHHFGLAGCNLDFELAFRDSRGPGSTEPANIEEILQFELITRCLSPNTVYLNVFDLASTLSIPNALLSNNAFNMTGAFHAAIEVFGEEWSFYRTPNPNACGICKSLRPRQHPVHVYRQSINLGETKLKDWEVRYLVRGKMASRWLGGKYHLLQRNCIHFCDELALALGVQPVPSWVRSLHETGASFFQVPWPLSLLFNAAAKPNTAEGEAESQVGVIEDDFQAEDTISLPTSDGSGEGAGGSEGRPEFSGPTVTAEVPAEDSSESTGSQPHWQGRDVAASQAVRVRG